MVADSRQYPMTGAVVGGVPIGPDVKRLIEAFPDIEVDEIISDERIAVVIGEKYGTSRYQTVTRGWRDEVFDVRGYELVRDNGGFRRISHWECSRRKTRSAILGMRHTARAVERQARVNTSDFDEVQLRTHTHTLRVLTAHVEHSRNTKKEIAPPAPPKALPRAKVE